MVTIYLSRLILEPRRRDVQRDLADCHDMHRRILSAFPDDASMVHARERFGVLYRIEQMGDDGIGVLVQSQQAPNWLRLPNGYLAQPAVTKDAGALYDQVRSGMELRFRLRANPVKRIRDRDTTQEERWRGKRVDLRSEEDQIAWLRRKGVQAGFALLMVKAQPQVADTQVAARSVVHGFRNDTKQMTFRSALFEGRLRVTDAEAFRRALEHGIGSGKAYGFGLLSIAPESSSS